MKESGLLRIGDLIIYNIHESATAYRLTIIGYIASISKYGKHTYALLDILYTSTGDSNFTFSTGSSPYIDNQIFRAKDDPHKAMRIVFNI